MDNEDNRFINTWAFRRYKIEIDTLQVRSLVKEFHCSNRQLVAANSFLNFAPL